MVKKYVLAAVMVATIALAGCGKEEINVNDYIQAYAEGIDEQGILYIDESGLESVINQTIANTQKDVSFVEMAVYYDAIRGAIDIDPDKSEGLSNGDVVNVAVTVNNDAIKKMKVKLVGTPFTYTVEGLRVLPKLTSEDLFKGVSVKFNGNNGEATAEIVCGESQMVLTNYNFSIDKNRELRNGDSITLTCQASSTDEYLIPEGTEMTKTLKVEDLPKYIRDAADIPEDVLQSIVADAQGVVDELICKDTNSTTTFLVKTDSYTKNGYVAISGDGYENLSFQEAYFGKTKNEIGEKLGMFSDEKVHNGIECVFKFDLKIAPDNQNYFLTDVFKDCYISAWIGELVKDKDGVVTYPSVSSNDFDGINCYNTYDYWHEKTFDDSANRYYYFEKIETN